MAPYTATCLCDACHITLDAVISTLICHCTSCRKMTSSAFSMNTPVRASDFHLVRGSDKIKTHNVIGASGAQSTMSFCGDCATTLWVDYGPMPELKIIKSGVLDGEGVMEREGVKPGVEQNTRRRPGWLCAVEGAVQFEGQQGTGKEEKGEEEAKKVGERDAA